MAKVVASILDPRLGPRQRDGEIEINRFADVIKMQTVADGIYIQLALSATDALAVAIRLIDLARSITEGAD